MRRNLPAAVVALALTLATLVTFAQVAGFDFLNYDDNGYVTRNEYVREGWTRDGLRWALGSTFHGHWHPLTWLSHMTDCELFGLEPGRHHLVSVALHLATTLLLFGVLRRMTGATWRSGLVAGLFALHPLHVEPVAWIAGRKDVLAGLFWMLTLWGYAAYSQRPGPLRYLLVLGLFTAGLMAKSVLITLPVILLLLDFWPLGRLRWETIEGALGRGRSLAERAAASRPALRLFAEKVPLLLVAFATGRLALSSLLESHGEDDAAGGLALRDDAFRDAPVLYARYLAKTLWPRDLALPYGRLEATPWEALGAGVLLLAVTGVVLARLRRQPYLAVGWGWFLVTLVPVVGFLRSGPHHLADRYAYLPLIGLFLAGAWLLGDLAGPARRRRLFAAPAAVALLLACAAGSWLQLGHWRDSGTLFSHALRVTGENAVAHNNLGRHRLDQGLLDEAEHHFAQAVRIQPDRTEAQFNLGHVRYLRGDLEAAIRGYAAAVELDGSWVQARIHLASALQEHGQLEEAVGQFRQVVWTEPSADNYFNLGQALTAAGRAEEALRYYRAALEIEPGHAHALAGIAEWFSY